MRSSGEIRGEERRQLIEPLDHRNNDACGRGRALPVEPYGGDAGAAWRQHVVVQVVADHEHLGARDGEPRYDGVPEPRVRFLEAKVTEAEDLRHEGVKRDPRQGAADRGARGGAGGARSRLAETGK